MIPKYNGSGKLSRAVPQQRPYVPAATRIGCDLRADCRKYLLQTGSGVTERLKQSGLCAVLGQWPIAAPVFSFE
jgi:hypothetical protein